MIIRLSVQDCEGNELFFFEPTVHIQEILIDRDVIIEFMRAIKSSVSTDTDTIDYVMFSGLILYFNQYEKYSLRLLVNHKLTKEKVHRFFEDIAREINLILKDQSNHRILFEAIKEKVEPQISSFLHITPIEERLPQKIPRVAVLGLASAGKTSIIYRFFEFWSTEMIENLQATVGMDISKKFQEFIENQIIILDFGGQEMFRNEHLSNSTLWVDLSSLIFVVDIQDRNSFEIAKAYLNQVWSLVARGNRKKPKLAIFLHKYDPLKRKELERNLSECLTIFNDFSHLSSFSLTSIKDSSSDAALINTLYFSLPEIILPKLLKIELPAFFEKIVNIRLLAFFKDLEFNLLPSSKKEKWIGWAEMQGISCGLSFQKTWLNYLRDKSTFKFPNPIYFQEPSRSIEIILEDQSISIIIQNSNFREISNTNLELLFTGYLTGLLKTFQLLPAKIVRENGKQIEWKIRL
ncbi:MAG: ADP-ribosylation factor-like protein [Promethearchaeota archaeon]